MKGRSFKGAAAYLLHDIDDHSHATRVAWTTTRNLATQNPDTAWKVMAATAIHADTLKEKAGIKNTGRKAQHSVMHLVLSWHPEEAASLTREDMVAAAESAIAALGAADRQALMIGHNDSAHPHLHVLLNRHSPIDGRILSSSKERLILSKWAQAYEEQRGKVYCEDRVLNNNARDRGEFTRAEPPLPRQLIQADKVIRLAANDNTSRALALRKEHLDKIRTLGQRNRALKKRHQNQWEHLQADHHQRRQTAHMAAQNAKRAARQEILSTYRPAWRDLRSLDLREREEFRQREASRMGRLRNLFRSIDIGRSAIDGEKPSLVSQIWKGLFSAEERRSMLHDLQQRRQEQLLAQQRAAIRARLLPIHVEKRLTQIRNADRFVAERSSLVFTQRAERAKLRAEWHALREERTAAYRTLEAAANTRRRFNETAQPQSIYERLKAQSRAREAPAPTHEQDNEQERE